jgi:hypothetical protein
MSGVWNGEIEDVAADVCPEPVPLFMREDVERAARAKRRLRGVGVGAVCGPDSAHVNLSDSDGGFARSGTAPAGAD